MTRFAPVASHFNLRDLGGLHTADGRVLAAGRLYRGASLHRLAGDDLEAVKALRLRSVLDLRSSLELRQTGSLAAADIAATVLHNPMFETVPDAALDSTSGPAMTLARLYSGMLEVGAAAIATTIERLADDRHLPLLFYCTAGKDRTGVMAAMILKLVGVSNEQIVADYAASKEPMEALIRWLRDSDLAAHREMMQLPRGLIEAPAEAMSRFLAELDERYASADGYARSCGVSRATIERVKRNLLRA